MIQEPFSSKTYPAGGIVNVVYSSWKEISCIEGVISEHFLSMASQYP